MIAFEKVRLNGNNV